jgi:hypothetical protein
MPGRTYDVTLGSHQNVTLAEWGNLAPTAHGQELQATPWTQETPRSALRFYDATNEYMRNTWAFSNMPSHVATVDHKPAVLFYHAKTDSWHTTDALDIDHAREWKAHLTDKGVASMAEANIAYNDIANLRMLPSSYNRARDHADGLEANKADNPGAWNAWRQKNFGYDQDNPPPPYDPVADRQQRNAQTLNADYDPSTGRKSLSFDDKVSNKWFEAELRKLHAGYVDVPKQGLPDNGTERVHLFRCPTTHQLVTRDAFDIDHARPIASLLKDAIEESPNGRISKAQALDIYNDTTNLRLVVRSANCSHEWELDRDGQFVDVEQGPKHKVGAHPPLEVPDMSDFIDDSAVDLGQDRIAFRQLREHLDRHPAPLPPRDPSEPVHEPPVTYKRNRNDDPHAEIQPVQPDFKRPRSVESGPEPHQLTDDPLDRALPRQFGPGDPRDPQHARHAEYQRVEQAVRNTGAFNPQQVENIAVGAFLQAEANPTVQRIDHVHVDPGRNIVSMTYAPSGLGTEPMHNTHLRIGDVQGKAPEQSVQEAAAVAQMRNLLAQDAQALGQSSQPQSMRQ